VAGGLRLEVRHGPQLLDARLQPGRAELLGVQVAWSEAHWERRGAEPPRLALQAEVQPVAVAELLKRLQPDFGWSGDLRIGARARIDSGAAVSARIEIARTGGDLQVSEFGSVQSLGLSDVRLELQADQGTWRLSQRIVGTHLGRVEGRQTVHADPQALWPAPEAAIEGELRVQVDNLATWGAWVPAGWRLGGHVDAALRIAGRVGAPELIGEAHGRGLALRNALEGVALSDGEFDARFEGTRARLARLRFAAGEGELVAEGEAQLGAAPQARLRLTATRATVLGRVDRRVVASGEALLRMEGASIEIDGDFRADSGRVDISRADAPSLGDDVTVRRGGADGDDAEAEAARRAPRDIDLNVKVDLGPSFRLRGRGIDTRLTGALTFTTPNGRLAAHGEIRTERGTYEAYGQKLEIERGVITFVGSVDNPRLDIEAVRAQSDVRVGVRVSGNVLSPRIALFSDPELPATDKLALLATGRSYDSLAGSEALVLQRAAMALLAGDGSGGGGARDPAALLRLDELSVRQSEGAVRDTIVTLGKQISDRVYVGYERGLSAAAGNWQLIYRIAQRFTLRAQSGDDPAIDLVWLFRWN
jgi:translocation and assembly module TamB